MPYRNRSLLLTAAWAVFGSGATAPLAPAGTLVPDDVARRAGMVRAWFSQAQLNPAQNSIESASLHGDMLVALTTAGVVHAMDALTGQTMWSVRIGNPGYPSLGPAVDAEHVAIVNGSTLYVLESATGRELLSRRVSGGAGGGPALANGYAYVPLFNGRVEGYSIADRKRRPWYYTSRGRIFRSAVASASSLVWSTDRSSLYVARSDATAVRFRFDTGAPIVAPATVRPPLVYAGSLAGYVFALNEDSGQQRWRYAAGFSVRESPVEVAGTLYVATDEPALHAIDAGTGERRWIAPGVKQFIAASQVRVYGIDDLGGLVGLDAKSGVVQGRTVNQGVNRAVLNDQTDRLYIYSRDGLIQCFHELGADEPYYHAKGPAEGADGETKKKSGGKGPDGGKEEPSDPFGGAEDPFGGGGGDPFGDGGDPFGGGGDAGGGDPFGGGGDAGGPGDDPFGGAEPSDDDPFGGAEPSDDDPFGPADEDPFG
ncbi:MAG: PQQ-binding-like beta-propeller repeat protein [Planctomycetota bacterium]